MKPCSLFVATATLLFALPSRAESTAPLAWTSCGVRGTPSDDVAGRTECSRLRVPRDYADPAAGMLDLDVVRVVASGERGERHDGTVLLEPDEFSSPIADQVTQMASTWRQGDEGWRRVARHMDLVGLAQRRMDDAGGRDCLSATSSLRQHASMAVDVTSSNRVVAEGLALAIATACQNDPMHAHIGAQPRIEDMERLREALDPSRMHMIAIGRGGWVAARYAERYPTHVGRLLLDSSWDADGSVAEALEARVEERGRTIRRAVSALVDAPGRYGWGSDSRAVHRHLAELPGRAYIAWSPSIVDANDLAAVLFLGRMLAHDAAMSPRALREALKTTPLTAVTEVDIEGAIRHAAERMIDRLESEQASDAFGFGARAAGMTPARIASAFASRCNDGSWGSDMSYWHARTLELREAWPSAIANETFQGMVCSEWPSAFGPSSVPNLQGVPAFLMLHAEFDGEAPLRNAALMLQGHSNASMVVARGLRAHGVLARVDRPCLSEAAGRFLGEGILPAMKLTNCRLPSEGTTP